MYIKKFCITAAMCFVACLTGISNVEAQSNSVVSTSWTGTDPLSIVSSTSGSDQNTVYLYNVGKKLWLGRGGRWGTEAILSEVAQEFTMSGSFSSGYKLKSSLQVEDGGSASFLTMADGSSKNIPNDWLNYYLDHNLDGGLSVVYFLPVSTTDGTNTYSIYSMSSNYPSRVSRNKPYYMAAAHNTGSSDDSGLSDYINAFLKNSLPTDKSDQWILVTRAEYKDKFQKANASQAQPVPGTFLMRDNDFARNDNEVTNWKCVFNGTEHNLYNGVTTSTSVSTDKNTYQHTPTDATNLYTYYVGNGYGNDNNQMQHGGKWTANIHGASGEVHQTLDGIFREGWYQVRCHAFTTGASGTAHLFASVDGATQKTTKFTEYAEDNILTLASAPTSYVNAYSVVNGSQIIDGATSYPYTASVLVYVSSKSSGMQNLKLGIKVSGAAKNAWTCFDSFQIYYLGSTANEVVLDETRTSVDYMNEQNTDKARNSKSTVYLHRSLNAGKWNSLVLPFSMNENQIQTVFGSGTIVSAFRGATDASHPNRLYFAETKAIEAGKLYIIKPSKGEDANQPEVTATVNSDNIKLSKGSSYYTIPQVNYGQTGVYQASVSGDKGSEAYKGPQLQFVGTYVSDSDDGEASIPANSYVLKGGTSETAGLWYYRTVKTKTKGFRGWLQQVSGNAKSTEFCINGIVDETTAIDDIEVSAPAVTVRRRGVYTLSGQRVREAGTQLTGLPDGIYIVDGRKVVVR